MSLAFPPDLSDNDGHPYSDDEADHPAFHESDAWERFGIQDLIKALPDEQAAAKCTGPVGTTCVLNLNTNWLGKTFEQAPDHILALHSFEYRVTGDLSARVTGPGKVQLSGDCRVDLKKQYNFDADKPPIKIWGVSCNVKDLSRMPTVGLARDYTVVGSTNQHLDLPGGS